MKKVCDCMKIHSDWLSYVPGACTERASRAGASTYCLGVLYATTNDSHLVLEWAKQSSELDFEVAFFKMKKTLAYFLALAMFVMAVLGACKLASSFNSIPLFSHGLQA